MILGNYVGEKLDGIFTIGGCILGIILRLLIVVGIFSIPCAAIKYLFFA